METNLCINIPKQLELLCALLDTTPQMLLNGFINDLSRTPFNNGIDRCTLASEYFVQCGYGMYFFELHQVRQMLEELNQIHYESLLLGSNHEAIYMIHAQCGVNAWYNRWKKEKIQGIRDKALQ